MLAETLNHMAVLAGSSGRSVQALEAGWPKDAPVSWSEAYASALVRAQRPAFDTTDGRTVAFLEGMQAAFRLIERR